MDPQQIRSALANLALALFVISTAVGAFLFAPWAGFVALGLTSGIAAWILGAE